MVVKVQALVPEVNVIVEDNIMLPYTDIATLDSVPENPVKFTLLIALPDVKVTVSEPAVTLTVGNNVVAMALVALIVLVPVDPAYVRLMTTVPVMLTKLTPDIPNVSHTVAPDPVILIAVPVPNAIVKP